jgi:hypothetical protein
MLLRRVDSWFGLGEVGAGTKICFLFQGSPDRLGLLKASLRNETGEIGLYRYRCSFPYSLLFSL